MKTKHYLPAYKTNYVWPFVKTWKLWSLG